MYAHFLSAPASDAARHHLDVDSASCFVDNKGRAGLQVSSSCFKWEHSHRCLVSGEYFD